MVLTTLDEGQVVREARADDLLALDEALIRLEAMNERQSRAVTYRFFGGLTHEEIAEAPGVSKPTVRRNWRLERPGGSKPRGPSAHRGFDRLCADAKTNPASTGGMIALRSNHPLF